MPLFIRLDSAFIIICFVYCGGVQRQYPSFDIASRNQPGDRFVLDAHGSNARLLRLCQRPIHFANALRNRAGIRVDDSDQPCMQSCLCQSVGVHLSGKAVHDKRKCASARRDYWANIATDSAPLQIRTSECECLIVFTKHNNRSWFTHLPTRARWSLRGPVPCLQLPGRPWS